MKLYDVPRNSMVRFLTKPILPIASQQPDDVLKFSHIDGMYSYCINSDGTVVHPAAFSDVEIVGRWEHKD